MEKQTILGPTVDSACQSKNQAMMLKKLSVELWESIVSRHQSGEGYLNIFAALKVPRNTVTSIILKWKKYGTKYCHSAKLSNRGHWSEGWPGAQWSLWQLQSSSVEMGEPSRRTTISAALHQLGIYGRVARSKPLLSKRHMTAGLEFTKRHLKRLSDHEKQDSLVWWNQDWTLWPQWQASRLQETWHHPFGEAWVAASCFSAAGTGRQVRIEAKMNGAKYREILDENLLHRAQDLGWRSTFQQDINLKHTAKTTQNWLWMSLSGPWNG